MRCPCRYAGPVQGNAPKSPPGVKAAFLTLKRPAESRIVREKLHADTMQGPDLKSRQVLSSFAAAHPRVINALLSIFTCALFVLLSEIVFHFVNRGSEEPWRSSTENLFQPNQRMGYKNTPNVRVSAKKFNSTTVAFTATYTIDQYGRRHVPIVDSDTRNKFLLLFGGSFVFGTGLDDEETLASRVAEQHSEYMPYVFATQGYGPSHFFLQATDDAYFEGVEQKEGVAVYVFIDGHMNRLVGRSWLVTNFAKDFPYLVLEDDYPVFKGNFTEGRSTITTFYRWFERSETFRFHWGLESKIQLPLRLMSNKNKRLLTRVMAASRDALTERYPACEFYVAFYPGTEFNSDLTPLLEEEGVNVLDYSELFPGPEEGYELPEGHPNPHAIALLADQLTEDVLE